MILVMLDTGVCTIYETEDASAPGGMSVLTPKLPAMAEAWYGELEFESNPVFQTELQEDVEISARIRILQDRRVNRQTLVDLADGKRYKVERAYHGYDKESGELITDINLSRVVSEYDAG